MSLQVWLPLNGTLDNYGLSKISITNNNATVENNGKIGKCYKFNGNSSIITTFSSQSEDISFCCWAYFNGIGCHLLDCRDSSGNGYQPMYISSTGIQIGNSQTGWATISYTFNINVWYHICVVHNNEKGIVYINGVKIGESTAAKGYNFNTTIPIYIGSRYSSTSYFSGYVNDFRIYNHALSAKEIKEISKALILHYPMNDISIQSMVNVYSYPTFATSSSNGGWSHWGRTGASGSYSQNTNTTYIYTKGQAYSHLVSNASSATGEYLLYQSPAFDGGYRSLQCIIKESNSLPITESIAFPAWNARTSNSIPNNFWTSIISLGDGFYLCKAEGINQDGSNDLVGIYICPGYSVYFSFVSLEDNRTICSNFQNNSNSLIYDCGIANCYDGTASGTIILQTDTPRYSYSYNFTSGAYIGLESNPLNNSSTDFTFSFWMKPDSSRFTNSCLWNGRTSVGGPFSIFIIGNNIRVDDGSYHTFSSYTVLNGSWQHCVITRDSSNIKLYINGELKQTLASTSFSSGIGTKATIGASSVNTSTGSGNTFAGNLSDYRIYAATLSADDVLELYHTAVFIDNQNNTYAYEFVE